MKTNLLIILLAIAGTIGCGKPAPVEEPRAEKEPPWVTALREGSTSNTVAIAEVKAWLEKNLPEGKATQQDVAAALGRPEKNVNSWVQMSRINLDRPKRDNEELWQYTLVENSGTGTYLVMQFDPEKQILLDCTFSYWICGFCPHVFAFDGGWRLEGKMLAGCVGAERAGTDTMLLPRLQARDGRLRVRLSNLAPETDYVSHAQLAAVPLKEGEELDISETGQPIVWCAQKELPVDFSQTDEISLPVNPNSDSDVLVLEVRNTLAFETEMRSVFLDGKKETAQTTLEVSFDGEKKVEVQPVGTKFLRRIVFAIPSATRKITLRAPNKFWHTRRLWLGQQNKKPAIYWQSPTQPKPLRLNLNEHAVLNFPAPIDGRFAFALRLRGYYEFDVAPTGNR